MGTLGAGGTLPSPPSRGYRLWCDEYAIEEKQAGQRRRRHAHFAYRTPAPPRCIYQAGTSTAPASMNRSLQYQTSGLSAINSQHDSTKVIAAAREKATR
jgi:hypothetical protein